MYVDAIGLRYWSVRLEDRRKGLAAVLGMQVLGSYLARGTGVGIVGTGAGAGSTGDEDVLLDGGGEHAKEGIVDVLADDVDTTWGTGDVGGWAPEAGLESVGEFVPAAANEKKKEC